MTRDGLSMILKDKYPEGVIRDLFNGDTAPIKIDDPAEWLYFTPTGFEYKEGVIDCCGVELSYVSPLFKLSISVSYNSFNRSYYNLVLMLPLHTSRPYRLSSCSVYNNSDFEKLKQRIEKRFIE